MFLDRDGVVVEETGYLHRVEDMVYLPGALEAVARLNRAGYAVVLVTNQAGIARGYYGWEEFAAVETALEAALAAAGGHLDGVWACPFHPEGQAPYAHPDHPFRKPNPGMIEDAARVLNLAREDSWLIGDKVCDLEAGLRGGLGGVVHVRTGHGGEHRPAVAALRAVWPHRRIEEADTLAAAVARLLAAERR